MKKYKVQIQDKARLDIQDAVYYYEEQSKGLGKRFTSQVLEASKTLKINPHFQIRYDDVRCLKLKSFPYSLHYIIEEIEEIVIIYAVIHTASDPDNAWLWKDE